MKSVADSKNDNILIIAAEASSCMYAKRFMKQWQLHSPKTQFFGVGDRAMEKKGMDCIGFAEELGVVGLQEVIKHWSEIKTCFQKIVERASQEKPRFALLLDYPGFNLRLAKKLNQMGVPVVYYISPQLWAWKKGRVSQVKKYVDDMMVVFPFEVDFYEEHGIKAHFVGHPLVEVVEEELAEIVTTQEKSGTALGLMPGSRRSEIGNNFLNQLKAAQVLQTRQDVHIKVLLAPTLEKKDLAPYLQQVGVEVEFLKGSPTHMIQQCDYILTASGTATLQVALSEKPMVVMYRMNPFTAMIARLLVRSVPSFCIVNLIAGEKVVPELFQHEANPNRLAEELELLIRDSAKRDKMLEGLKRVKAKLGKGGATENLVDFLNRKYGNI